jgi:presenilin-like A22 family membrane protease
MMKRPDDINRARRAFWRPTRFEAGVGILVVVAWFLGIIVVIHHEQAGWLLSLAYLLIAIIGICVSWLILWPVLRIVVHAMEND